MDFSPFGKAVAIALVALLLFLFPLPYIAKAVNETVEDLVNTHVTEFSDTARQQGTITKEAYEKMIHNLDRTGELYDIDIEVSHPVSGTEPAKLLGDRMPDDGKVKILYSKAEASEDDEYEGQEHNNEIQSFSTHTHNDICYAGHRHVPVYGTTNITNIPVYMERRWETINAFGVYGNGYVYKMYCACCGTLIYTYAIVFGYTNSGYAVSYDSSGNPLVSVFSLTGSGFNSTIAMTVMSELDAYVVANSNDPTDNKTTVDFYYPSNSIPTLTSSGLRTTVPIACYNTRKHPNTTGCYNVGKIDGNYIAYASGSYDTSYQYYYNNFYIECASCHTIVLQMGICYCDLYAYGYYNAGSNVTFLDYNSNGVSFSNGAYSLIQTNDYYGYKYLNRNDWSSKWRTTAQTMRSRVTSLPYEYNTVNGNTYNFKSLPTRDPINTFPVCYRIGNLAPIIWEPFRGCTKCGTYGQRLSCGQAQDETPICNQVVTSITATEPVQSVSMKEEFVSTANASYLDGHMGMVNCSNNLDTNKIGDQTVTLTYNGLVGNAKTIGTRTCTVNTTVKDTNLLTDILVSPLSQEVSRYQTPSFTVTAQYNNNTSKQVMGFTLVGFNSRILGKQAVTLSYKEGDVTKTTSAEVTVKNLTATCSTCNIVYYLDDNDIDQGCPSCNSTIDEITVNPDNIVLHQGDPLDIIVEAIYKNGIRSVITEWTSNYEPTQAGIQDVTITYQNFRVEISVDVRLALKTCSICSLEYEFNDNGTDPGCPSCSKTVVRIDASPRELTIDKHQTIPITVRATYKDGHTTVINDWASNLLADTAGIYEVMILYQNVIDIIKVTVMEDGQIGCPYCGLKYLFNDSPKGCPSCYITLSEIEASLRSGGIKVPYRSKLNLQITKIFKDEHRELIYTGWTVSDFDPGKLGSQTITVHYEGFQDLLDIEMVDDLPEVTCRNGHTYYLNADGSDPGCPYCSSTENKVEALFLFDTTYTNFILDEIYTHGEFRLEKGDYLKVTIRPKKVSILARLIRLFHGLVKQEYIFGGEVS